MKLGVSEPCLSVRDFERPDWWASPYKNVAPPSNILRTDAPDFCHKRNVVKLQQTKTGETEIDRFTFDELVKKLGRSDCGVLTLIQRHKLTLGYYYTWADKWDTRFTGGRLCKKCHLYHPASDFANDTRHSCKECEKKMAIAKATRRAELHRQTILRDKKRRESARLACEPLLVGLLESVLGEV